MRKAIQTILLLIQCSLINKTQAQSPAFYHLSTAEGLSDNNVYHAVRDQNGMVWVATGEGLNSFDGNRIHTYYKYDNPGLADNHIERLLVDSSNNIWIRTPTPFITMLDGKRQFHKYPVGDTAEAGSITGMFLTTRGVVAIRNGKHYVYGKNNSFTRLITPFDDNITNTGFSYFINNSQALYYRNNTLLLADYRQLKITMKLNISGLSGASQYAEDELMAYNNEGSTFWIISISQQKIIREYRNQVKDQHGLPPAGTLRSHTQIDDNRFAFTTYFSGIYIIDFSTLKAEHYVHDPADPRSLGGNNTMHIRYDTSGYLFVTTQTSGLHFCNLRQPQPVTRPYFTDSNKNLFDGYIQAICTGKSGIIWLAAQDRLIRWNRAANRTDFIPLQLPGGITLLGNETIRYVYETEDRHTWVGTSRYGLLLLDAQAKLVKQYNTGNSQLPSPAINAVVPGRNGQLWICSGRGTRIITPQNEMITLDAHPLLKEISKTNCTSAWMDEDSIMWFTTTRGAWSYNEKKQQLRQYTTREGLIGNNIEAICKDEHGNVYFATTSGLSIMNPEGKITSYNLTNGLRHDRCDALLKDNNGNIWIGNLGTIMRYDPVRQIFSVFEEGLGFSHGGYRVRSAAITPGGELIWGTDKGLIMFHPGQLNHDPLPLHPFIYSLEAARQFTQFTQSETMRFPYNTSSFVFSFSSGELGGDRKVHFRCRLQGYDKDWITPTGTGQLVYSTLPPGTYHFKIKASRDGITWYEAPDTITLIINKPWWQQTWFRLSCAAILLAAAAGIIRYLRKRKQQRDIRETVDYFAASSYEHSTPDNIYHDITRNCISHIGFEDCVVYVPDYERNVLVQKAAYGPKNSTANEIINPLEIPIGKGIVGTVAQTGKAELVNDTSRDSRYIVDDTRRYSELTVPVIHEGRLIAIIDSEHSRKNYFTKEHLAAMQTIASLCAAKIARSMAVEAMSKSRIELMELNTRMAETRFLNLRLQMNPHFLFNSLSAIQHLIVSQQTNQAYKYLTVFSNFLRSLLNFSDKNFIPLDEEMKILKMYIELESLRFDQSFSWEITAEESLEQDEILVPSLMIQPFAENAIWHGLLHKEGEKKLSIRFKGSEDHLTCIIRDNGIGREKAAAIKESNINSRMRESRGIAIIQERLALLQQKTGKPAKVETEDLRDKAGHAAGTSVTIIIPYYNPEET